MDKQSKPEVVLNSVRLLKESQFGATGIKVELEAQLEREYHGTWDSDSRCHAYLMEKLAELGLAEKLEDDFIDLSHGVETEWHPKGALAYAEFYNDGSVDSELTFTIKLDDPSNIFLVPKIVSIWSDFMHKVCETTGTLDIDGSGMHMALINDPDCKYPSGITPAHIKRFDNFNRSMTLLLPSLYFLGSTDETSRPLEYREPRITVYDGDREWSQRRMFKFSAITYNEGALEFRVFQPSYAYPEMILDNFVVMANAVRKYWRTKYRKTGIEKITRNCRFGNDRNMSLERFYVTIEHIDLLNEGLKRLKPSYYTIRQLKDQRSFRVNKRSLKGAINKVKRDAIQQYKEYEARFNWQLKIERYGIIRDTLDSEMYSRNLVEVTTEEETRIVAEAEKSADDRIESRKAGKQSRTSFIEEAVVRHEQSKQARWVLEV